MPAELERINLLSKRLVLSDEQRQRLEYQRKGYVGERVLDDLLTGNDDRVLLPVPDLKAVSVQSVRFGYGLEQSPR
ncbi:hypothetical protein [Salisediminibacterium beveridgei]|nr:hypothetical protein [Salisediminibacterium beveridgei]